jgi:hypothetical protein
MHRGGGVDRADSVKARTGRNEAVVTSLKCFTSHHIFAAVINIFRSKTLKAALSLSKAGRKISQWAFYKYCLRVNCLG